MPLQHHHSCGSLCANASDQRSPHPHGAQASEAEQQGQTSTADAAAQAPNADTAAVASSSTQDGGQAASPGGNAGLAAGGVAFGALIFLMVRCDHSFQPAASLVHSHVQPGAVVSAEASCTSICIEMLPSVCRRGIALDGHMLHSRFGNENEWLRCRFSSGGLTFNTLEKDAVRFDAALQNGKPTVAGTRLCKSNKLVL